MKNKKSVLIVSLIYFFVLTAFVACINNSSLDITYQGEPNPSAVPVLYYESNVGNEDYSTHTFLLDESKKKELGEHRRSFSKTYPISALENKDYNQKIYGQLLSYYRSLDGEFYIFDNSMSTQKKRQFTLILNEFKTEIEYSKNEYYYLALRYDDTYYVLCMDQKDENYDDLDTLKVYSFTSQLKKKQLINIDLRKLNIKPYNIINKSIAISNKSIIIPIKKENEDYFLLYNFYTKKTILEKKPYNIIGAISEHDNYLLIGHKNSNLIIERVSLSEEGEKISEKSIDLGIVYNKLTNEQIQFDDILYLYNDRIYLSYRYLGTIFYLSVDCQDWNKKSLWKLKSNKNDNMILMDCKFMINVKGEYYDIYPNTVVSGSL